MANRTLIEVRFGTMIDTEACIRNGATTEANQTDSGGNVHAPCVHIKPATRRPIDREGTHGTDPAIDVD